MAKFYGIIGYVKSIESEPGIWTDDIVEHTHIGDITKNTKRYQTTSDINDNINISNTISIVTTPYAALNYPYMKYVILDGVKWKISDIDIQSPRILITTSGGIFI